MMSSGRKPEKNWRVMRSMFSLNQTSFKGGSVHLENAALRLIHDFQRGKWGRMTLDKPVSSATIPL
jgi:hypothetical protein